ncbi:MAG: hypothetical protein LC708_02205, partial [Actinobacteria bacterium]|nr:hypothetical protein [Actinomycetota bacterium]
STPKPVVCYADRNAPDPKPTNCLDPGGFGPPPVYGNSLKAECTATESGVTGKATFEKSFYATATDAEGSPLPSATFPIPDNNSSLPGAQPAPNTVRHGVITNVGDVFTVVFNQQIINPDKSLTVNAVHMYLFGPTAVGEVVRGQVNCGTTPSSATSTDTIAPSCGTPVVEPMSPEDPTPKDPRTELVGTFDAGTGAAGTGIKTVDIMDEVNADVSIGDPDPDWPQYTKFTQGQTGPLPLVATRLDEALPMSWKVKVTDMAGNVSICYGVSTPGPAEFTVADGRVNEGHSGTSTATFVVTRSGDDRKVSTVKYNTTDGTATAGTDYVGVTTLTTLTFNPGIVSQPVAITVKGDTLPEKDETFNLVLSAATGGTLADTTGTTTIVNDDAPAYLSVADIVVNEGNSGTTAATFTVARSGNTSAVSTVKYNTSAGATNPATAGTDYAAITTLTTLTFNPGDTTKTVSTTVTGDTADEPNETFTLALSGAVGATVSDTEATATIVDNEGTAVAGPATWLIIGDISVTEGNSGPTAATFTVTRSGNTSAAGTVTYVTGGGTATGGGTDYTSIPAGTVLNFTAGQASATVTTNVTGDTLPEAAETFKVTLSAPTTGTVLSDKAATATIVNDDGAAYLTVANISGNEGNSGTIPFTFTITRSGNTSATSTVKVTTSGGTATGGGADYTSVAAGTLVSFGAGATSKTVVVNVIGDTTVEAKETFDLVMSSEVGATISDTTGTATIVNDD